MNESRELREHIYIYIYIHSSEMLGHGLHGISY